MDFTKSAGLQERLQRLAPGGAHTHARGSDLYPDGMAPVLVCRRVLEGAPPGVGGPVAPALRRFAGAAGR